MASATPWKAPTLGRAATDGLVTVEIGDEEPKKYYIHRALLVHHSEYFRKALQGPWIEAKENRVVLKDVDEAVFNIFVHWLYVQQFPTKPSRHILDWDDILSKDGSVTGWIEGLTIQINAYCFGDRILAPGFRRAMSKAIADDLIHDDLDIDQVQELIDCAFDSVPVDSPILQLIVDRFCATWCEKGDDTIDVDTLSSFPKRFMMRAMRRYSELWVVTPEDEENEKKVIRCYYEHDSGEEKKKPCPHQHMVYNKKRDFGYFE